MIKTFDDIDAENIFNGESSQKYNNLQKVIKRKLDMIHYAFSENDLRVPPANHYEHLKGDLKGFSAIRINNQYRIVFKFEDGFVYNVKIMDYHK